jgi:uncharacterized coiled-coil protein SlyX
MTNAEKANMLLLDTLEERLDYLYDMIENRDRIIDDLREQLAEQIVISDDKQFKVHELTNRYNILNDALHRCNAARNEIIIKHDLSFHAGYGIYDAAYWINMVGSKDE